MGEWAKFHTRYPIPHTLYPIYSPTHLLTHHLPQPLSPIPPFPMHPNLLGLIQSFSQLHIGVIGEAMLDSYLLGSADRLCAEAPVPVVALSDRQDIPGGAANTAVNLARLGAEVSFLSVVGADHEAELLRHTLAQHGISTNGLLAQVSRRTLVKHRVMAASQMLLRFDQGSTEEISAESEQRLIQQVREGFDQWDAIAISDYAYGILTPQIIDAIAQLQAQTPKLIVVDSKRLTSYRSVGATVVKPNYKEAIQLLGLQNIEPASDQGVATRVEQILHHQEQLLERTGAEIAAVTLDRDGALLLQRHASPQYIPAKSKTCACTTGAGDTFISALTLALAAKTSVATAGEVASSAAAIVVEKTGTATCSASELQMQVTTETQPQREIWRGKEPLRPNLMTERNESTQEVA